MEHAPRRAVWLDVRVLNSFLVKKPRKRSKVSFYRKDEKSAKDYSKNRHHPFGEAINHLDFDSDLCFSLRLCRGSFNSYCVF